MYLSTGNKFFKIFFKHALIFFTFCHLLSVFKKIILLHKNFFGYLYRDYCYLLSLLWIFNLKKIRKKRGKINKNAHWTCFETFEWLDWSYCIYNKSNYKWVFYLHFPLDPLLFPSFPTFYLSLKNIKFYKKFRCNNNWVKKSTFISINLSICTNIQSN